MGKPLRILIVEDSEDDAQLLFFELERNGYDPEFERVETRESMADALKRRQWDIIISDYIMPRFSGLHALEVLKQSGLDLPFIILSGNIGEDIAVEAMRAGAHDYIIKGNLARLAPAVERELREAEVRRARRIAEEERVRLATAVESAAEAVVITDIQGSIQYVNPAFEKITGYTREEARGQTLHILDSNKHDAVFYAALRETLRRDGIWAGRLIQKKKNGQLYEEECTCSSVKNGSGNIINYVFIKRDVTEKLRLEAIAEAVNTMDNIGYVFSGVRHEIGNPINSINMIVGILQAKLPELSEEGIKEYVDRIKNQVSRIEELLKSLKSFNMYESMEIRKIQLPGFLKDIGVLVNEGKAKRVNIPDSDIPPGAEYVYADPRALQQVMLNILANASDAVCDKEDPKISITVSGAGSMIRIQVEDNGCGMSTDQLKDVFKPFHTTKPGGTGLGLVIVKKMLTKMNGTIEITSRLNEGTIVDIYLPGRHGRSFEAGGNPSELQS